MRTYIFSPVCFIQSILNWIAEMVNESEQVESIQTQNLCRNGTCMCANLYIAIFFMNDEILILCPFLCLLISHKILIVLTLMISEMIVNCCNTVLLVSGRSRISFAMGGAPTLRNPYLDPPWIRHNHTHSPEIVQKQHLLYTVFHVENLCLHKIS